MSKKGLRGLATGLFIATSVLGYMYFFQTTQAESDKQEETMPEIQLSSEEMMTILEEQGFIILEEQQYNSLLEKTATEEEDDRIEATVTIEQGMSSTDVALALEEAEIISDHHEFIHFVEEQNASSQIRRGEYLLHSEMSFQEIIEIIT